MKFGIARILKLAILNGWNNISEIQLDYNSNNIKNILSIHDPRLGRFLSVHPYSGSYSGNRPYAFCENSPIAFIKLEGLEKTTPDAVAAVKETITPYQRKL